jgi:hypothetical protein
LELLSQLSKPPLGEFFKNHPKNVHESSKLSEPIQTYPNLSELIQTYPNLS